jgi:lipopolysaccharide export LptBFGC system permease protein LptF
LRKSDITVALSVFAFSFWLAPRSGSRMKKAISNAMMMPGMAETVKLIRQPKCWPT